MEAEEQAESGLQQSVLVRTVAQGNDRKQLVQEELRAGVEELRTSQMVSVSTTRMHGLDENKH